MKRTGTSKSSDPEQVGRPFAVNDERPSLWERIFFGNVSSGQLSQFCRQFAAFLEAGVDIFKSLNSLEKQFGRTAALKPALALDSDEDPRRLDPRRGHARR